MPHPLATGALCSIGASAARGPASRDRARKPHEPRGAAARWRASRHRSRLLRADVARRATPSATLAPPVSTALAFAGRNPTHRAGFPTRNVEILPANRNGPPYRN